MGDAGGHTVGTVERVPGRWVVVFWGEGVIGVKSAQRVMLGGHTVGTGQRQSTHSRTIMGQTSKINVPP